MAGDTRPILLSFTSDPYQEAERTQRVTRDAIHILADNQLQIRLLTKNPAMALELDRDLLLKANVEFGTTMLFVDDKKRAEWEPHAPSIESRMTAMKAAHGLGLRTWVSVEPVIDTKEALRLIETANPFVDLWKVGRWNHDEGAQAIKWPRFAREALELLNSLRADYYIKAGLWQAAEPSVRALFAREVRHEHASVQQ
ncbi:MAG: hypothetical protein IMZ50_14010 [Candidatus Atribacteria bacterium]|nr:hypothetical protein [Candidatus Atribacteria bacterium]